MALKSVSDAIDKLEVQEEDTKQDIKDVLTELQSKVTDGAAKKYKIIGITAPSDGTETDTGEALAADDIVHNVYLNIATAEATGTTKTLDVGTLSSGSGDANGYLIEADVSSTGVVQGTVDMTNVDGTATTLGALLVETNTTNDTAVRTNHLFGTDNVSITAASANFSELVADIIIEYTHVE